MFWGLSDTLNHRLAASPVNAQKTPAPLPEIPAKRGVGFDGTGPPRAS